MKIYIGHLRDADFKKELYEPIQNSSLHKEHEFILPHENSNDSFDSRDFLKNECDLMVAEVSHPSTGLGIELGWAHSHNIPIVCIYRKGSKPANSLKRLTDNFIEYSDSEEMVQKLKKAIEEMQIIK